MKPKTYHGIFLSVVLTIFIFAPCYGDITSSLHFYASDFDTATILGQDSTYYISVRCNLPNQAPIDSVSAPYLPVLTYLYSLPQGVEVSGITISNRQSQLLDSIAYPVFPTQTPMLTRIGEQEPPFVSPGSTYSQTRYPSENYTIIYPQPLMFSFGMGMATIQVMPLWYEISQNRV
jgi:hypothetical protein